MQKMQNLVLLIILKYDFSRKMLMSIKCEVKAK